VEDQTPPLEVYPEIRLPDGRASFRCPACAARLLAAAAATGPCPGCGRNLTLHLTRPDNAEADWRAVRFSAPDDPHAALAMDRPRPRRRRRARPAFVILSLVVVAISLLTGFLATRRLADLIATWQLARGDLTPEPRIQRPETRVELTPSELLARRSQTAREVLNGFAAAGEPAAWAGWTVEGAVLEESFHRLVERGMPLASGMPDPSLFRPVALNRLAWLEEPVFTWEARSQGESGAHLLVAVLPRDGRMLVAGRLFYEAAAGRLAAFLRPGGDPAARFDVLVKASRATGASEQYRPDPGQAVVELSPPALDEPVVLVPLSHDSKLGAILRGQGPGEFVHATLVLGRDAQRPELPVVLEESALGWPAIDARPLDSVAPAPPWGSDTGTAVRAREALGRFLAAEGDSRFNCLRDPNAAGLLRELDLAFGPPPPPTTAAAFAQTLPRTLERAGAVCFGLAAPTADHQGASAIWLVPYGGDYKVDGWIFAQSHYGLFRRLLAGPAPGSVALRGIVTLLEALPEESGFAVRFRDIHGEDAVEFEMPADHPAAAGLRKLARGESRHATLRLAWREQAGAQPRIALDEWLCWGYQGIDDQVF
jgi:hypothetical protein